MGDPIRIEYLRLLAHDNWLGGCSVSDGEQFTCGRTVKLELYDTPAGAVRATLCPDACHNEKSRIWYPAAIACIELRGH